MIPACRVVVSEPPGDQAPSGSLHLRLLPVEGATTGGILSEIASRKRDVSSQTVTRSLTWKRATVQKSPS